LFGQFDPDEDYDYQQGRLSWRFWVLSATFTYQTVRYRQGL